ncbi:hypothetical protein BD309DRAFT_877181, partial [Dichomitus squalens]
NTPVRPIGTGTTYITRFSEPITSVMVSHFLIDLHEVNLRMTHQMSFLSLDVMSRLDTPQSIVFRAPSGSDSSDASTEDYGEDSVSLRDV